MQLRRLFAAAVVVAVAFGASAAHAQPVVQGEGIRLGERLVLHLGTGLEFRFDDNVFYVDRDKTSAFLFRFTPILTLATRPVARDGSRHKVDFMFNVGLDYNEYLTSDEALARHRQVGVTAGASVSIFSSGVFGADFYDNFVRVSQAPYNLSTPYNLNRDTNELGTRLHFRPGGGRLQIDLNYAFGIEYWEEELLKPFNLHYHRLQLQTQWKFFPKTAIYIRGEYNPYVYFSPGDFAHPNSNSLRVTFGLIGLITPKLTVDLYAGYANPFYESGPSSHTGVGGITLNWKPIAITGLAVGYSHDFVNSIISSYYDRDSVFVSANQMLWRFLLNVRLQYENRRFQGILPGIGVEPPTGRTDHNLTFSARIDYPFKKFMAVSLDYQLMWNKSNSSINYGALGLFPVDYTKNQVGLRFTINY